MLIHSQTAPFRSIPLTLSLIGWLSFVIYWSAAAKNASPARSSESQTSRRVHEFLVNAALLLAFIPVPGLTHRVLPNTPVFAWTGVVIQAVSELLAIWARRHLGSNWSGEITAKVNHQLITSGPYRLVRHPIYTAMLGMFLGTAFVSGQLHAALALVMVALAYWRKIRLEEVNLDKVFGPAYETYRRVTPALIPPFL